ncbi:hypothetical protein EJ05DRAFT_296856 [Pseudovirgaria hyperparasitica]|uniref:Uncharacterized protein n=1 Tax=Pseudovirgaria hyperparasitica TaxID=470096 RepID=A0A6A6VRX5_9PEZI|nr:uncharacterized protein EJ05DRAFT_296856 [Pseudovirgaria hyperparasitica]KAF2752536.1 hypothetical protein EJ05DRAFT_296856 [Pseudovirgaria hyperparasitica]
MPVTRPSFDTAARQQWPPLTSAFWGINQQSNHASPGIDTSSQGSLNSMPNHSLTRVIEPHSSRRIEATGDSFHPNLTTSPGIVSSSADSSRASPSTAPSTPPDEGADTSSARNPSSESTSSIDKAASGLSEHPIQHSQAAGKHPNLCPTQSSVLESGSNLNASTRQRTQNNGDSSSSLTGVCISTTPSRIHLDAVARDMAVGDDSSVHGSHSGCNSHLVAPNPTEDAISLPGTKRPYSGPANDADLIEDNICHGIKRFRGDFRFSGSRLQTG